MHVGVAWKGNAGAYERQGGSRGLANDTDVGRVIVRREEGNKEGAKKRTRGVNNKGHIAMKQGRWAPGPKPK
jgi:hypothetical protein